MAKVRFNPKGVARENKALVTMQVQFPDRQAVHIQTIDNTIMARLANCIKLLMEFKSLSTTDGPAFICHQDMASATLKSAKGSLLYRRQQPGSPDVEQVIEASPHGMVFLEVFKLVPHLQSYRQQHHFMPLIQALLDVDKEFSDVAADLVFFNGSHIEVALPFVCLERWNLAIAKLQSIITTEAFETEEWSYYASVRNKVDVRLDKLRSRTNATGKLPYLSVIDLFFHHENNPDSNKPSTFYQHQPYKTSFAQIAQAVNDFIEKLRRRKRLRHFEGVVVSIKYSEVRGWYASAMLLFNYPPEFAYITSYTENYAGYRTQAYAFTSVDVEAEVNAVMGIWRLEINAGEDESGKPIYPQACIHTPAFLCPFLPSTNGKDCRLYFFSANAPVLRKSGVRLIRVRRRFRAVVEVLDYLFLSQCFMKYKGDPHSSERRMIRSYRL